MPRYVTPRKLPGCSREYIIKKELENNIGYIDANLRNVSGSDWAELKKFIADAKITDEESSAVDRTIQILQSLKSISNKEEIIKRAAKNYSDIAIALNVFRNKGISTDRVLKGSDISFSAEQLFNAVSHFADAGDLKGVERAGVMNEEELAEAKEKIGRAHVS